MNDMNIHHVKSIVVTQARELKGQFALTFVSDITIIDDVGREMRINLFSDEKPSLDIKLAKYI